MWETTCRQSAIEFSRGRGKEPPSFLTALGGQVVRPEDRAERPSTPAEQDSTETDHAKIRTLFRE